MSSSLRLLGLFVCCSLVSAEKEYGCVIDAGSSGSRIYVYSWQKSTETRVPEVTEEFSYKQRPGIAQIADNATQLRDHLRALIDKAKETIPDADQSGTPIYLMATAGMRLLLENDTNRLVDDIRDQLEQPDLNPFEFNRQNARVLSGEEEGAYAWIAVNYLRGAFTNTSIPTYGVLEMGGASTQIAFVHKKSIMANKFPVRLGCKTYPLYVHSYLYYGLDYATRWQRQQLAMANPDKTTINDPCMLQGDQAVETINGQQITFNGAGNFASCLNIFQKLVYKAAPNRCWPKPCAIGTVYQPTIKFSTKKFQTLGSYAFGVIGLQAGDEEGWWSPGSMNASMNVDDYCSMSMDDAQEFSSEPTQRFLSSFCVSGAYFPLLLTKGYGLPAGPRRLIGTLRINDKKPEWALGAIIGEMERRQGSCYSYSSSVNSTVSLVSASLPLLISVITVIFGLQVQS